jgi:PEP-CTERM motif
MRAKPMQRMLVAAAVAAAMLPATAAELAGAAPLGSPDGIQNDASTSEPPWVQSINVAAAGTLESIVWWGFHGGSSQGASFDDFVVTLGGTLQSGTISVTDAGAGISRYELDVTDAALAAGANTLEIVNASSDVEWLWQCSAVDCINTGAPVAYSLVGTLAGGGDVPEPATYALLLLGAVAARAATQRRKAA